MPDTSLQALLDPDSSGNGIEIIRRVDAPGGIITSYYVQASGARSNIISGTSQWVDVTTANTDAQKNTAIRAALGVP